MADVGRHRLFLAFLFAAIVIDQGTKLWVTKALWPQQSATLIPGVLYLTLTYNAGIAFGYLQHVRWLTVPLSIAVIAAALIGYFRAETKTRFVSIFLGLLIGGAASNLFDRIVHGRVTDFFDLKWWPVFNIADCAIVVSVLVLGLRWTFAPTPNKAVEPLEEVPEQP